MDEIQEKIARLPLWAREHIKFLQARADPQTEEIIRLRKEVDRLDKAIRRKNDQIGAMVEMFQCAAKGENEVAKAVQGIVEEYIVSDE